MQKIIIGEDEPDLAELVAFNLDRVGFETMVADSGVGVPSGDLPFIFRRFYRVEKHHSQGEIKGTGLGLSIVKRAIEAHGGEINVTSTPGQETKFEILLPPNRIGTPIAVKAETENAPTVKRS